MSTMLPQDSNNHPIPVLRLKPGGAHTIAAGAGSTKNTSAFDNKTRVVSLYATVPVYVAFGDSSVTATAGDHYFPAGVYYDFAIGGDGMAQASHVAALAVDSAGDVYISEKI